MISAREQLRIAFVRASLGSAIELEPASQDASFRSYFRATRGSDSWIVMDAPPPQENCAPFVDVAARLHAVNVHAPRIVDQNLKQGFLVLEDLGTQSYSDALNFASAEDLYADAMDTLLSIAQADTQGLPRYDEPLLRYELGLFPEWLLTCHLGYTLTPSFYRDWTHLCDFLIDSALAQPFVFVHRDYHCRNLMVVDENNPGVIDFQDAVRGPITYDLVSLLRDCYVRWPQRQVQRWLDQYRNMVLKAQLTDADHSTWQYWCDLMGVQRHLKAAGIFCRLYHRDGKADYLKDIARTLGYVAQVCADHATLAWMADLVEEILPQLEQAYP